MHVCLMKASVVAFQFGGLPKGSSNEHHDCELTRDLIEFQIYTRTGGRLVLRRIAATTTSYIMYFRYVWTFPPQNRFPIKSILHAASDEQTSAGDYIDNCQRDIYIITMIFLIILVIYLWERNATES